MNFFNFLKRKRKGTAKTVVKEDSAEVKFVNTTVNICDIFVVTSEIIPSLIEEEDWGPKCLIKYFLAKCKNGEYYELFSGEKLEKEPEPEDGFVFQTFDTYYVKKAEPLNKYLNNTKQETIDTQTLFDFITKLNIDKKS